MIPTNPARLLSLCVSTIVLVCSVQAQEPDVEIARSIKQLGSPVRLARWQATYDLGRRGEQAGEATEALKGVLDNPEENWYVHAGAAWALGQIGAGAQTSTITLLRTVRESDQPSVRRFAVGALGRVARPTTELATELESIARADTDPRVRVAAAESLWRLSGPERGLQPLLDALASDEPEQAYASAVALGRFEAEAAGATDALVEALGSSDEDVARAASRSLIQIGSASTEPVVHALQAPEATVRRRAIEILGRLGPSHVALLVSALDDPDPLVRRSAAGALGRLGSDAASASSALLDAVGDPDPTVRKTAAEALRRVEPL